LTNVAADPGVFSDILIYSPIRTKENKMAEIIANVNWLAVVVGAVVAYLLGMLWYSPKLFGTIWAAGVGVSFDDASGLPVMAMITQAVGTFLLAWVVGVTAASNALLTIILIVVAMVTLMAAGGMYAKESGKVIAINTGFVVAMTIIMIVCQGIF
jgi:hypothetical protein